MTTHFGSAPGPDAQLFETFVRVRFHEIDGLGHVNNAAYLNYLEQAAIDHATFLGLDLQRSRDLGGVFVARRHEILFVKPSFAGDLLRVVTWVDDPAGVRIHRHYRVYREQLHRATLPASGGLIQSGPLPDRGNLVVEAATEWVFVGQAGTPARIPREIVALFSDA